MSAAYFEEADPQKPSPVFKLRLAGAEHFTPAKENFAGRRVSAAEFVVRGSANLPQGCRLAKMSASPRG